MVSRSKNKWYKAKNVQQYALKTKLKALQILTNDDEVENQSLSSFVLAVTKIWQDSCLTSAILILGRPCK